MNDNRAAILQKIKEGGAPVGHHHPGDEDTLVPATDTRLWVDTMKDLKLGYSVHSALVNVRDVAAMRRSRYDKTREAIGGTRLLLY